MNAPIQSRAHRVATEERLRECIHCGLCLNACPTYVELGTEMDSPRGRIALIRSLEEGRQSVTPDVVRHLDLCLGCRACESACPSGVQYGSIIEEARSYIEMTYRRRRWDHWRRQAILWMFPYPKRLRVLLTAARLLQKLGCWRAVQRVILAAGLVPLVERPHALPEVSAATGSERSRVALLSGCVSRELLPQTNQATVRVLTENGVTVVIPSGQGCCGALHLHSGDPQTARQLARRNVDVFAANFDAIVTNTAGCGAAMKEYGTLLSGDRTYAARAQDFAARVRDVTEFLTNLPARSPERTVTSRVTYHDACHLAHGQQIREAPRDLLRLIPGLELVELPESDVCCGSAGSYNLTESSMAGRLRNRKIDNILRTESSCVVSANPGCSLQIQAGLRARGLAIRVVHPVELLNEAYSTTGGQPSAKFITADTSELGDC